MNVKICTLLTIAMLLTGCATGFAPVRAPTSVSYPMPPVQPLPQSTQQDAVAAAFEQCQRTYGSSVDPDTQRALSACRNDSLRAYQQLSRDAYNAAQMSNRSASMAVRALDQEARRRERALRTNVQSVDRLARTFKRIFD